MKILLSSLAAIALAAPVSVVSAHVDPTSDQEDINEILVIGDKARKKRIHTFIRNVIEPSRADQYARYAKRICPVAMGLPDEHNRVIEYRMRQVADAAGIKTRKPGCDANLAVVVVQEPRDILRELRTKHPQIFGEISLPDRRRLISQPGPVYAWHDVETRGGMGARAQSLSGAMVLESSVTGMTSIGGSTEGQAYRSGNSRYTRSTRQDLNLSVVVIESSALKGLDLRQVADYALMRLTGDTGDQNIDDLPERSILTLFAPRAEGEEPPLSVTAWDLAFLKSLYKSKRNVSAAQQRSSMATIFEKEIMKAASETENN